MSRAEAQVLLARLTSLIRDLRDLQWADGTPQHVVSATADHIRTLEETAAELRRMHGVTSP